jgi:uncharacterized membrane protein (UPF0182 family)
MKRRRVFWLALAGVVFALILVSETTGLIEKWLWMRQLGYVHVFWEIFSVKWTLFGIAFGCVFLYLWINLILAAGKRPPVRREVIEWEGEASPENAFRIPGTLSRAKAFVAALVPAFFFALAYYPQWDTYLRFRWGGAFEEIDPIFHLNVGFYLFRLPMYELIQNGLVALTFITLLIVAGAYFYLGAFQRAQSWSLRGGWPFVVHLSVLFLLFVSSLGWGFYLDRYELLYATRGVVYGMGYTDYHVTRVALWIMLFVSLALAGVVSVSLVTRRFRFLLGGVGGFFVLYFLILIVLPPLVQKYKVAPSELELETPYLEHNIQFTRKAFNLDAIQEKTYPALMDLTFEDIQKNPETVDNVRLWDWRPILETYRQTQEIRLYYQFYDVDVGRYHTEDGYHQVMLSARELAPELPAKARTWVNQYLQFTHGYGLVMNFVSKKDPEGLPQYVVKDIPPVSLYNLAVKQPAIYYGEMMPGYRIVATTVKEFDYPKGNKNVYTSYGGHGGIPLDSFWKRILFAWTRSDINILLSSYLGPESRIQIWRRVQERVAKIAPFLKLDSDPYLVLSKGKLYWIQDAYTTSDRFPYSEPFQQSFQRVAYIRNSVKVVVDAYEGSVFFYVADPHDPVLRLYRAAFPGLFRPLKDLSEDLRKHLRYPEDLFSIQADKYRTYHMTDPQVFYNQEDLWAFAQEKYAGSTTLMVPYYILMRLPDTGELQYLLMTPFTPQNRDNMIAWMAVKCDFPEYGKIVVYQLPKERLTFGPIQVEAMIDQNTIISEQLSLWDQRGSRVIRGNLVVIPIEKSFLYVEPVYLTAEGTNIPQLKRIIVNSGRNVVMEPTLDESLKALFGTQKVVEKEVPVRRQPQALSEAKEDFKKAEEAIKEGKWEDFGKSMGELKQLLNPDH